MRDKRGRGLVQEKCGAEKEVNISRGYVLNIEIVMVPDMRDGRSWTILMCGVECMSFALVI